MKTVVREILSDWPGSMSGDVVGVLVDQRHSSIVTIIALGHAERQSTSCLTWCSAGGHTNCRLMYQSFPLSGYSRHNFVPRRWSKSVMNLILIVPAHAWPTHDCTNGPGPLHGKVSRTAPCPGMGIIPPGQNSLLNWWKLWSTLGFRFSRR